MSDISRASPNGTLPFNGIGQDSALGAMAPKSTLQIIQAFLQLPPALGSAKPQHHGSLVSNANGAPQLGSITLNFSPDDLAAALLALQGKTQDAQLRTAKEGLATNSKKLEDQKQRSLDKIKEWSAKCQDAASKAKAGGILGWFKKAFTVVAAAFTVALAAVATVATGGAAAPLLVLATLSLVSAAVSLASEIDKAKGGKGFDHVLQWMDPGALLGKGVGAAAKALGASEETVNKISSGVAIAVCIGVMVASIILSGGSSALSSVSHLAKIGAIGASVFGGATEMALGAVNRSVAEDRLAADKIQSDKKMIDAFIAKLQQQMEEGREDIKKVLDEVMEGMNIVNQMISASNANRAQINANMTGKGQSI